jgi:nitrogen-specific signal transduction histidine kinase/ActR/RegA family two-component response regulator
MNSGDGPSPSHEAGEAEFIDQAKAEKLAILQCAQESARLEGVGLLAGGIAHDFNNLLTGILGYVELAMENIEDREHSLTMLRNAVEAGARARSLCAQVLNHVRHGVQDDDSVDLHLLVKDAASLVGTASKRVHFHLSLLAVPSITGGSMVEFRQILLNILVNATEAMGESGGNVWIDTGHLHVAQRGSRAVKPGDYIELRIRDDGHGMSPEVKDRIFEPFYTTKPHGTGIGLASVRRTLHSLGGAIEVESEIGAGTLFTLLFPLVDSSAQASPTRARKGRVMVVDDEEPLAELMAQVLTTHGYDVDVASGGKAAMDLLLVSRDAYVAIILDLTMPGMDGAETLMALRGAGLKSPVILMSGLERNLALYRVPRGEYASFLRKPFSPANILSALQAVLDPSSQGTDESVLMLEDD